MLTWRTDQRKKRLLLLLSASTIIFMILLTTFIVIPVDSNPTGASVELQNQDSSPKTTPILDHSTMPFDTKTQLNGTVIYSVSAGTKIDIQPSFLYIRSDSGTFNLSIKAECSENTILKHTGLTFNLSEGTNSYSSRIIQPDYSGMLMDGSTPAVLEKNTRYSITVTTAIDYEGTLPTTELSDITFTFKIQPSEDWREISFVSDDETIETNLRTNTDTIGSFPNVSKQGYELKGWFCNGRQVTETTLVSSLESDVIKAVWSLNVPDTPNDPIKWPIITETVEREVEGDLIKETILTEIRYEDGSVYKIVTIRYLDKENNIVKGDAHADFDVKGGLCSMDVIRENGAVYAPVPIINDVYIQ